MSLVNNHDMNRRNFLRGAAGGALGASLLPNMLNAQDEYAVTLPVGGKAKSVIYLYMAGGFSHLDSFDIKPENAEVRGDAGALKTNADGVRVSKYFPKLAKQMDKVAVINTLSTTQGAHAEGNYFMHCSYIKRGTIEHPQLGAWASKFLKKLSPTLPSFVKVGNSGKTLGAGFFEGRYGALPIGSPKEGLQYGSRHKSISAEQFDERMALLKKMNATFSARYRQKLVKSYSDAYKGAVNLMTSEDLKAFDISQEKDEIRTAYGNNSFGEGCLLARRLVEKGVRFIEVSMGGWDNHNNIYDIFPEKARTVDQAMGTLLEDLRQRGLLDSTLVVLTTEFGRSPKFNENKGRNHYPKAFSGLLAGGGIRGGQVYGKTDAAGKEIIENKVKVPHFNATIAHAMGLDTKMITMSASGRPFRVADKGKPIAALF